MKQHNRTLLMEIKNDLLQILHKYPSVEEYDNTQIEYLLSLIDYMVLEKYPVCKFTIKSFMEEIITSSIYGMNPYLLGTLHKVGKLEEEDSGSEVHLWDD